MSPMDLFQESRWSFDYASRLTWHQKVVREGLIEPLIPRFGVMFSTDCVMCHSTNPGWMPALIDHDFFPLTLGHDIQDCASCHNVGDFSDISTDCFACHESDYDQTTNPNHVAANFPTDCAECHTTNPGWIPAEFDHDGSYFPIYSGVHRNEWNDCIDCHINPSDYSVFTCLTCHERNDTDDDHEDVADYIYESNACLQCHPDGSE